MHNVTPDEYRQMYPDAKFKCEDLIKLVSDLTKGKSYEERFGLAKAIELKKVR